MQGVAGRLHTFLCVRKITFFLRVLSMYLTFTDLHFPVFRAFLPFFGGSQWRSVEVICKPFPKSENFLRVPFSALPSFRGDSR